MKILNSQNKEITKINKTIKLNSNLYILSNSENVFPLKSSMTIGTSKKYNKTLLRQGDQIRIQQKSGTFQNFYVTYFINNSSIVVSTNRPTTNIFLTLLKHLKWFN